MNFEFATSARILFGAGRVAELPALARSFGARALVVTGKNQERSAAFLANLRHGGLDPVGFGVGAEPDMDCVREGARLAREAQAQLIIAVGGGSAIDAGKAIAALATNDGDLFDYLEVIGKGRPLAQPVLPIIAVPTTAGTGAEVTRNAVLHSAEHQVKVSLRSALLLPSVALVDPELTVTLPPALTRNTGLDALTQLIEPFVCRRATPMTDALCREALPRIAHSLRRAFDHPQDVGARSDMALASLFGGLALANAGLGAVHGFAAAIGGVCAIPHGAVCAALLPDVMEANLRAAQEQNAIETVRRYDEVARVLANLQTARAADGVQWVRDLCRDLRVASLSSLGLKRESFPALVAKALASSSMKGNPIELTPAQLAEVLESSS